MTSFNSQEEFLRALEENPAWKEAVRAIILGEELLRLPVEFRAFVARVSSFIDQTEGFISEQRQFNAEQRQINERMETFVTEQRQFNADQRQFNAGFMRRLDRIEGDIGTLKGPFAENAAKNNGAAIAAELGLEFVRSVPLEDLVRMSRSAIGRIPTNQLRSFWNADLVMEVSDGSNTHYIAVEASYTADKRDTDRAQRNARFLEEFTGQTARAVLVSVRNDHYVSSQVESGAVYWYQLEDRGSYLA